MRKLTSIGKFNEAKGEHSDGSFFLYVGDEDPDADLYVSRLVLNVIIAGDHGFTLHGILY